MTNSSISGLLDTLYCREKYLLPAKRRNARFQYEYGRWHGVLFINFDRTNNISCLAGENSNKEKKLSKS